MTLTWSKERQAELYRRNAHKSFRRLVRWMKENEDLIIAEGEKRSLGIGFEQYGDASYHLTYQQLVQGRLEEVADAVKYGEIIISKGWT